MSPVCQMAQRLPMSRDTLLLEEAVMTWKDKLEIGLKEDAPYRKDNLPVSEVKGPELPAGPGRSPEIPAARTTPEAAPSETRPRKVPAKPRRVVPVRIGPPKSTG